MIASALLGGSVFVHFFLISMISLGIFLAGHKTRKKRYREGSRGQSRAVMEYSNIHCFSYREHEEATDGFREELGRVLLE